MATQALGPGATVPRRRVLFGLLDGDGWTWAGLKAGFWLIVIIFMLGYLPDRAYYFTVNRTIDLGILAWSPINLCPPVPNEDLPCPPPVGAMTPWHPNPVPPASPVSLALPEARTDGGAVQVGSNIVYVGGSDGETAQADVFVAEAVPVGNFDAWQEGPPLPEPRAKASVLSEGGSVYVIGGLDAEGNPTDTVFVLTPDAETGELGEWEPGDEALTLPEPRAGASIAATATGLVLAGGTGPDGVSGTAWQAPFDDQGTLKPWQEVARLSVPVTDAEIVNTGSNVWLYGGSDPEGRPVGAVQRGEFGLPPGPGEEANPDEGLVVAWSTNDEANLPEARTNAAGWGASGGLYLAGGSDGTTSRQEAYWAVPDSEGNIPEWKHLDVSDLPAPGLEGAAPVLTGPNIVLIGGTSNGDVLASSARSSLAPQAPFFQLGILGATVPALKIEGEIGQQLGYMNAALVGTVNFIILLIIGWAYAHKEQSRAFFERIIERRRRRKATRG
jgi:Kelch motif